jgi:hypothetical protein
MTDLEISKALALAIGWPSTKIHTHLHGTGYAVSIIQPDMESVLRIFDYRDWNVIGPIAERYRCFPQWLVQRGGFWWVSDIDSNGNEWVDVEADTPQKAITLPIIGAKK